ncbi:MAG: hypothetical protein GX100_09295 [candidate division WS1 bacterium]|nr:hypothetical protein [candidate division WS1 bacterium]
MGDFPDEVGDALRSGGYDFQVLPGHHWIGQFDLAHGINPDLQATKGVLISLVRLSSGTSGGGELWGELERLIEAAEDSGYAKAYLVLCGEGWHLGDREVTEAMTEYLPPPELEILRPEEFVVRLRTDQL